METMEMQAPVFEALLLFHKEPAALESERIRQALAEKFNGADFTEGRYLLHAFDAAVQIGAPAPFDHTMVSDFIRGQMWNVKDANGLLSSCTCAVRLADDNALTMEYKQRGKMLTQLIEAGLALYPDSAAVYVPASGRLMTAAQVRENPARGGDRFLYLCVNTRLFSISGTSSDMMVDTVGLYLLGLPDIQYHFHSLNPNKVMKHAYSVASLLYSVGAVMKSGETIDGMDNYGISPEIRWPFQYEQALIEPPRVVMAITAGEYAV